MKLQDLQPATPRPEEPKPPAPLLPVALGMILGIVADSVVAVTIWVSAGLVCLGVLVLVLAPRMVTAGRRWISAAGPARLSARLGFAALMVAAAGLGSFRHTIADRRLAENHVVFFTNEEPILAELRGRILTPPRISEPRQDVPRAYPMGPKTRFIMQATDIAGRRSAIRVSGKVAVVVKGAVLSQHAGDTVTMTGWLYRPPGPSNPGAYDWRRHHRRNGLLVGMSCEHAESVIMRTDGASRGWRDVLDRIRGRLHGYLLDDAFEEGDPGAGVMAAMVLGERSAVSRAMNEAFVRTGNAHFLAASGMHVGWLALMAWGFCRILGLYYRTTAIIVGLLILSYVLLAEPRPSILRAGIIGVLTCITVFFRGRYNALNSLSLAAILILLLNPTDLFRPAFEYSFMAVLALLHLCPQVSRMIASTLMQVRLHSLARSFDGTLYGVVLATSDLKAHSTLADVRRKISFVLAQLGALALSAWFITAPLSCYHFNNFTPFGWLQTLLLWFVALPVTFVGFITVFLGVLAPSTGAVCGSILKGGTDLMIMVVQLLARMPGTYVDGRSPSLAWVLAVYAVLWIWVYSRHWIVWKHGFKVLTLVLVLWWCVPPRWGQAEPDALRVWTLDVGAGAGTVIELPNGKVLVYDFGTRSPFDAGPVGVAFLKHRGITRLDTVFVSHANFDHYGGIEAIAEQFSIGRLAVNDQFERFAPDRSSARRFLTAMKNTGIPIEVTRGRHTFDGMGDVTVEAIWPPAAEQRPLDDPNEASTVLRIAYQGRSILLTGDIGEAGMAALMAGDGLAADGLALPHHGSVVGNTGRFIATVDPQVAVRSSSQRQATTLSGIKDLVGGRRFFNTADDGCVLLEVRDGELIARAMASGL